jgi:hypothetical protein
MKAYLSVVPNKNSKTSSNSFYHKLTLEDGSRFLFTESQIASLKIEHGGTLKILLRLKIYFRLRLKNLRSLRNFLDNGRVDH